MWGVIVDIFICILMHGVTAVSRELLVVARFDRGLVLVFDACFLISVNRFIYFVVCNYLTWRYISLMLIHSLHWFLVALD